MDVYVLADPRDGRIRYVGISKDWKKRLKAHCHSPYADERASNGRLSDWKCQLLEQGIPLDAFQIAAGLTLAEAEAMEVAYIATLRQAGEPILNIHAGGARGNNRPVTEETRARLRAAGLGRKLPPEVRAKISAANTGRVKSPQERAKLSAANTGRKHSAEENAKVSAALRGRTPSLEHRAHVAAAHEGVPLSPRHIAKIVEGRLRSGGWRRATPELLARLSEAHRLRYQRKPMTAETKAKIGAGNRGKKQSLEHRAKIGDAHRGRPMHPRTRAALTAGYRAYCEAKRAKNAGGP